MTTHAPPRPGAHPVQDQLSDEATATLAPPAEELIVASARLLDHRSRSRLIPQRLAGRGRYLAFQDGEETLLHPLPSSITHIGRGTAAEVRLEEKGISRDHAIIVRHGRYARLLDNRSSNGTFLNGRRIIATNLQDGDVIYLGAVAVPYLEIR